MEPIHRAAYDGDVAAIDRLVAEDGERLNARNQVELHLERFDSRECTPLMLAAYRGHAAVARLLALGADLGLQCFSGSFATHWACYGGHSSSLALLLNAGASVTAHDNRGRTPLMMAAAHGATYCVTLLLARLGNNVGEQVGMVDNEGNSVAHYACWNNHPSTLALLLDAGASMTARTNRGQTLLMAAAEKGATDCVTLLLARGGDSLELDAQKGDGVTALHLAAHEGSHQAVSLLLDAGADPSIEDNQFRTAFDEAQAQQHRECADLLYAALAEPERPRDLFEARALLDVGRARRIVGVQLAALGLPRELRQHIWELAAPAYLKGRVQRGDPLPRVEVVEQGAQAANEDEEEKRAACLKYAMGLEGGGGVVLEGQEPTVGMPPDVFGELLELLVPKWDPARKYRPLGEGYIDVMIVRDGGFLAL